LTVNDLYTVLRNLRFDLDTESLSNLCQLYAENKDQKVSYSSLISDLILTSDKREVTVSKVYKYLTKNDKIQLSPDVIKNAYNAE